MPPIPSGSGQFSVIQAAAPSVGVEVNAINVRDAGEIERAVAAFARSLPMVVRRGVERPRPHDGVALVSRAPTPDITRRWWGTVRAATTRRTLEDDYRFSTLWQIMTPVWQAAIGLPPVIWWKNLERILLAVDDLGCIDLLA